MDDDDILGKMSHFQYNSVLFSSISSISNSLCIQTKMCVYDTLEYDFTIYLGLFSLLIKFSREDEHFKSVS